MQPAQGTRAPSPHAGHIVCVFTCTRAHPGFARRTTERGRTQVLTPPVGHLKEASKLDAAASVGATNAVVTATSTARKLKGLNEKRLLPAPRRWSAGGCRCCGGVRWWRRQCNAGWSRGRSCIRRGNRSVTGRRRRLLSHLCGKGCVRGAARRYVARGCEPCGPVYTYMSPRQRSLRSPPSVASSSPRVVAHEGVSADAPLLPACSPHLCRRAIPGSPAERGLTPMTQAVLV